MGISGFAKRAVDIINSAKSKGTNNTTKDDFAEKQTAQTPQITPRANANDANYTNKDTKFDHNAFTYDDYAESETASQALSALNSQLGAKPSDYQSTWQGQLGPIIDKILNREDFSYDLNSDALYQQYKDQYTQQGKLAMANAMGQAAALTGGYGSSHATSAGNQAYQAYLSQLNEVMPEFYGMALDRYNQEGEELYNNYALLADQENQEYQRHQDEYSKWLNETQLAYDRHDAERNYDYNQYLNERDYAYGVYSDDKSYAYNEYRDAVADSQWQKEYDENVRQFNANYNLAKKQYEDSKAVSAASGDGNQALDHVSSMSSAEIVETMQGYQYDKNNIGLATFLDDCVASGRLTKAQADEYYSKYRVDGNNDQVDTTVAPTSSGDSNFLELLKKYAPNGRKVK